MDKIWNSLLNHKSIVSIKNKLHHITFDSMNGISLLELIRLYFVGLIKGAFTYRASAIAFSFFMALFPFALFILNLIPYIPLERFQADFLIFIEESVPPNTFDAISSIIKDIMNNKNQSLLSSGFLLSMFLMANGMNALLDGFEMSYNISEKRGYFRQYTVAIGLSIISALLLLVTVSIFIVIEIVLYKIKLQDYVSSNISILQWSRYIFAFLMILTIISLIYKLGTRETKRLAFYSYGSVFTAVLFVLTSYLFGIYVEKFARYNELYGSIGTLLVMMFYVWINCILMLLGFELNALLYKLKTKN